MVCRFVKRKLYHSIMPVLSIIVCCVVCCMTSLKLINAVFEEELSAAVDSGMGTMTNIFGSKHCLN